MECWDNQALSLSQTSVEKMLKYREPGGNGKYVIPIHGNKSSTINTIPIRISKKYKLYRSDIIYEERGDGGLFIKKGKSPSMKITASPVE